MANAALQPGSQPALIEEQVDTAVLLTVPHFPAAGRIGRQGRQAAGADGLANGVAVVDSAPDGILDRARRIAAGGVKEIVLTGVNLGDFGNGTEVIEGTRAKKEALFVDLVRELDQDRKSTRLNSSH